MPLALNDVVRVRIAISIQVGGVDRSVGQVYDENTTSWTDVVWIYIGATNVRLREFGNVEFWCRVSSLALTRDSVTRPAVSLLSWCAGGIEADTFVYQPTAATLVSWARLQAGGSDIYTDLPGLGSILNTVGIEGYSYARPGFSGRLKNPVCWSSIYAGYLAKVTAYHTGETTRRDYISHISGSSDTLAGFNAWLAANQPELGSPITLGVSGTKMTLPYPGSSLMALDAFSVAISIVLNGSAYGLGWIATGNTCQLAATDNTATVCGPLTVRRGGFGTSYVLTPPPPPSTVTLGTVLAAPLTGNFSPRVPVGGGTLTAVITAVNLTVTLTVDANGRVVACNATHPSYTLQGWGVCREEGGALA